MPRHPEVHFRLKPQIQKEQHSSKPKKNFSKCSIYLQFIFNGHRLYYSFGQIVNKKDWNPQKQRVKKKDATTADGKYALNDLLDNLKKLCEKSYNESLKSGIPTPVYLKKILQDFINQNHSDKRIEKPTFFKLAERFINGEIKNRGKDKSKSSLKTYHAVTKHLKDFQVAIKYPISFDSINLNFFYKYTSYLKDKLKLAPNTIAKDISILKVFMAEAVDLKYTTNNEFRHKKFAYSEIETDAVYLTENELDLLFKHDFSKNKKLENVRDLFIFGAWVGLRFSDFSNIHQENIVELESDGIKDYFIKIVTQKTKELVYIPCNPVVF